MEALVGPLAPAGRPRSAGAFADEVAALSVSMLRAPRAKGGRR